MFELQCLIPLDETWKDRERQIIESIGIPDHSLAGVGRINVWYKGTYKEVEDMRNKLLRIPKTTVIIQMRDDLDVEGLRS